MSIVPIEAGDTVGHTTGVLDEVALAAVTDPWERARLAAELASHLRRRSATALKLRREAVRELVSKPGVTQCHVADYLGLTPTRINQLLAADRASIRAVA